MNINLIDNVKKNVKRTFRTTSPLYIVLFIVLFLYTAFMLYLMFLFVITCLLMVVDIPQLDWILGTEIIGI